MNGMRPNVEARDETKGKVGNEQENTFRVDEKHGDHPGWKGHLSVVPEADLQRG